MDSICFALHALTKQLILSWSHIHWPNAHLLCYAQDSLSTKCLFDRNISSPNFTINMHTHSAWMAGQGFGMSKSNMPVPCFHQLLLSGDNQEALIHIRLLVEPSESLSSYLIYLGSFTKCLLDLLSCMKWLETEVSSAPCLHHYGCYGGVITLHTGRGCSVFNVRKV